MPIRTKQLIDKKFGMLTVLAKVQPKRHHSGVYLLCMCDCGQPVIVLKHNLIVDGGTRSCGCLGGRRKTRWNIREANEMYEEMFGGSDDGFR